MCWTCKKFFFKKEIASQDISVIKFLKNTKESPFRGYPYKEVKEYPKVDIKILECSNGEYDTYGEYIAYEGYHSFIPEAYFSYFPRLLIYTPYIFIIPKGSVYYINACGEVISESIIFTDIQIPSDIFRKFYL